MIISLTSLIELAKLEGVEDIPEAGVSLEDSRWHKWVNMQTYVMTIVQAYGPNACSLGSEAPRSLLQDTGQCWPAASLEW